MPYDAQQAVNRNAAAPIDVVWRVLSDFAAISDWAPNVDHSCLLRTVGDQQQEGLDLVRRVQTGRTTLRERVITWDEPRELAYELAGLPAVVSRAVNLWELRPTGPATTSITLTSGVDVGPRPPQKLVANVVAKVMVRAGEQMIDGLVARVERLAADPTTDAVVSA